ncbi:MAG: ATP-dependent Lon protease [Polaribacter sp.]
MKSINLAKKHHAILRGEFPQVSRQTIYTALKYFNDSPTAKAIRKRAKDLLVEEAKEVVI